jgi:hypothetical protein
LHSGPEVAWHKQLAVLTPAESVVFAHGDRLLHLPALLSCDQEELHQLSASHVTLAPQWQDKAFFVAPLVLTQVVTAGGGGGVVVHRVPFASSLSQ